jgi:carbamoyl-phosphate synthase large subunit
MRDNRICLLVSTPSDSRARLDEVSIRSEALLRSIPIVTTEAGARATVAAIRYMAGHKWNVRALQDYYTKSYFGLAQFPDD